MIKTLSIAAAIASLGVSLSGCVSDEASKVVFNTPYGNATAMVHDQNGPIFLNALDSDKWYLNYVVKGDPTDIQLAGVASVEKGCRIVGKKEQPNPLVSIGSSAAVYGALGAAYGPAVAMVNKAYKTVQSVNSAAVVTSDLLGGVANGIISLGSVTYSFEDCGKTMLEEVFPQSQIHVLQKAPY